MHAVELSPVIIERVTQRRGRQHLFNEIDASSAALLVIDMQNCFCLEGQPAFVDTTRDIIPLINRLAGAMRAAGGLVVWVKMAATPESITNWSVFYDVFNGPEMRRRMTEALTPGTIGFELHDDLQPAQEDIESVKTRFSAMIQGSSDLDATLRQRGIDTLLITGTVTNVCCESTARDANMLNYKTIFVSDANAARTDDEHNATLNSMLNMFCDVRPTEEVLALLAAASPAEGERRAG